MIRTLALVAGLCGGVATSQAPEFTQQYVQRLAGQVDALTTVVMDFDASALAAGLGREEALQQMTGTDFLTARQADMRATFARHVRLADHLATLRAASPAARLLMPHRLSDADTLRSTWSDYRPALPLTAAGLMAGVAGFAICYLFLAGLLGLVRRPVRPAARVGTTPRREPTLQAAPAQAPLRPTLMGERR